MVRRPLRSGQTGITAKWLPRWTGPHHVGERMPNGDNYHLEHDETGKLLDPTNVDKLVKVEPWSISKPNPDQLNSNSGDDTPPETPPHHLSAQFENGSFIVNEKFGDILDDDNNRIMIEELCVWLKSQNEHKSSTREACKYLMQKESE